MATWFFEPGHTAALFRARHMMVTYVRGHFKNVSGSLVFDPENPVPSSVDVTIDAGAIWTGQPQRDAHLRSADLWMSSIILGSYSQAIRWKWPARATTS
jgi:polyisoprenoid-binding protein YceI